RHDVRSGGRINGDASVTLPLGRVECGVRLARRVQPARNVRMRRLDFLQADDVPRIAAGEPVREALALRRPDSVDVESDDPHGKARAAADRGGRRKKLRAEFTQAVTRAATRG